MNTIVMILVFLLGCFVGWQAAFGKYSNVIRDKVREAEGKAKEEIDYLKGELQKHIEK